MKKRAHQFWLASTLSLCLATPSLSQAQTPITSDGTLSTEVTTQDNFNFTINNGSQVGGNLFHSFSEFSVPDKGSAFFNNPPDIDNIISRVTGGSISQIDGLIRANPSANLFLINPKGIIFGPNARLEIGGSFLASTANRLNFANGSFFSAIDPRVQPLLTISVPTGLQFGETAGEIINQSQATGNRVIPGFGVIEGQPVGLQVNSGKTLALVGGGVKLQGGLLTAPEGRIELGSVAGTGQVSIKPIEEGWLLGYESVQDFQNITLSQGAFVNTSGVGSSGTIHLRGRKIVITGNSSVEASTFGVQPGGSIAINASDLVEVSDSSALLTQTFGAGKAGDITIKTPRLIVSDGGAIRTSTQDSGQAGNITVNASKSVEVIRSPSSSTPSVIEAQTFSASENAGNAGTVRIATGRLILNEGGRIINSTVGAGDGGTLIVDASESVEVSGRSKDGASPSSLLAQSSGGQATGNAGILKVDTRQLTVKDGARISVGAVEETFRRGRLGVSKGQGGDLRITASESIEVSGTGRDNNGRIVPSTLLAESQGPGDAGNLTIETSRLNVQNGAEVSVNGTGEGAAGNLEINADSIRLDNQGSLSAETRGSKGNITLQADNILLRRNSSITTNATQAASGGNITIDTVVLSVLENSRITANAVRGQGGNIQITTQGLFRSPDSRITAESELGIDGEVQINTLNDPSSGLVTLPAELVDISGLIAQGCAAGGGNVARAGKFVATGRGGLPPTPTEALRSDAVLADLGTPVQGEDRASAASPNLTDSQPTPLVEAQGWVIGSKGEVVLTAQAPTVTRIPWLTPTSCNAS